MFNTKNIEIVELDTCNYSGRSISNFRLRLHLYFDFIELPNYINYQNYY